MDYHKYFKNELWSSHSVGGSDSVTYIEIDFAKPLTVGEFISMLESVKDTKYHGYISTGLLRDVAKHNKGVFERLEAFGEDKDKVIKEACINLAWSEMNFTLKC